MNNAPSLEIHYAITQDNCDGQPWPPDGAELWSIVSRDSGFTKWRRIALNTRAAFAAGDMHVSTARQKHKD